MRVVFALILVAVLLAGCFPTPPVPTRIPTKTPTGVVTETVTPVATAPTATGTPIVLAPPTFSECAPLVTPMPAPASTPAPDALVARTYTTDSTGKQIEPITVAFTDGETIVAGRPADIEQVVAAANALLGQQGLPALTWNERDLLNQSDAFGLQTRLYTYERNDKADARTVTNVVRQAAVELKLPVFADPNLLASVAATAQRNDCPVADAEGSPLSGEGSPLSGEGSPLSGEGSPLSGEGSPAPGNGPLTAPEELYWWQWAFQKEDGINLTTDGKRRELPTGERTRVIIFDTSPFEETGLAQFKGAGWPEPNMAVCVEHPVPVGVTDRGACADLPDEADHGIFVAGLTHAVAPGARLNLVRVLDDHGKGELSDFLYALGHIDRGALRGSVLNMSLGFVVSPTVPGPTLNNVCEFSDSTNCRRALEAIRDPGTPPEVLAALVDQDGMTLYLAIADTLDAGALIVAAAGNHSGAGGALAPQLPAAFARGNPALLAVAAATKEGERAYYSHSGLLAAPGGGNAVNRCEPGSSPNCNDSLDYWLVSAAQHEDSALGKYWSYGAWMGTSFATPLVSGAAALRIAAGANAENAAADTLMEVCASAGPDSALGKGILCLP